MRKKRKKLFSWLREVEGVGCYQDALQKGERTPEGKPNLQTPPHVRAACSIPEIERLSQIVNRTYLQTVQHTWSGNCHVTDPDRIKRDIIKNIFLPKM